MQFKRLKLEYPSNTITSGSLVPQHHGHTGDGQDEEEEGGGKEEEEE